MLNRDDGKNVGQNFGAIGVGEMREVLLDGKPGKHHYSGRVTCVVDGEPQDSQIYFDTLVGGELTVIVDKTKVDLAAGRMPIQVSSPDGKVELRISGASDGEPLLEHEQEFAGHDPATPFSSLGNPCPRASRWGGSTSRSPTAMARSRASRTPLVDQHPARRSQLRDGFGQHRPRRGAQATGQPRQDRRCAGQAQESQPPPKLYIAGHTDTVGTAAHNLDLSRRRAQSIAGWFRKNGLRIPISYEGFGEFALLIATPDNTDERRNRRVDYILATEDPVLKATEFQAVWKPIK